MSSYVIICHHKPAYAIICHHNTICGFTFDRKKCHSNTNDNDNHNDNHNDTSNHNDIDRFDSFWINSVFKMIIGINQSYHR